MCPDGVTDCLAPPALLAAAGGIGCRLLGGALCSPLESAWVCVTRVCAPLHFRLRVSCCCRCCLRQQDKIDAMAAKHPDRFKVTYVVDKPK